eukprot:TRINITY_DN5980_c0_g1_i1.p1 TRINITY_DN5980_c0_g1~~TRINITY_DN5980_c0_g1_i1.p1  ORF type:complete len:397 (+),score=104.09 TRINITY_DN5980_c0_g1_i1:2-1192(+)
MGGMTYPDDDWMSVLLNENELSEMIDVIPFHCYAESWESIDVEQWIDNESYDYFLSIIKDNNAPGSIRQPIWVNEMGMPTFLANENYTSPEAREIGEMRQAQWFARAVPTFLSAPYISHIGFYEIKDLRRDEAAIGDIINYSLGLCTSDREKKMAFSTVKTLVALLGGNITTCDDEIELVEVLSFVGHFNDSSSLTLPGDVINDQRIRLYGHLFRRESPSDSDGDIEADTPVLFLWFKDYGNDGDDDDGNGDDNDNDNDGDDDNDVDEDDSDNVGEDDEKYGEGDSEEGDGDEGDEGDEGEDAENNGSEESSGGHSSSGSNSGDVDNLDEMWSRIVSVTNIKARVTLAREGSKLWQYDVTDGSVMPLSDGLSADDKVITVMLLEENNVAILRLDPN